MKVEHEGFILEIEEVPADIGNFNYYKAVCKEVPNFPSGLFKVELGRVISGFKCSVDSHLAKRKKDLKEVDSVLTEQTKENMKITSTYRGYPVEIKLDENKLYSCTIKTRYGVEDKEIFVKPIDYILYQQQGIVDNYKSFGEIAPNERVYHILKIEYKDFTLISYYNYNTNQTFFSSISTKSKDEKNISKEGLDFTPSTNTQELIDQFISFVDSKEEKKDNHLKLNGKTFNIWKDPNTKDYYCYFASVKLTGKTVEEVKDQIDKIFEAFS